MFTPLRQFLILLLVLLQVAAPLVHAHVGIQAENSAGLHLPELGRLHAGSGASVEAVNRLQIDGHSVVVELGAVIKLTKVDHNAPSALPISGQLALFPPSPVLELVNFSPHHLPIYIALPCLGGNICRAPPV